jgi:hypothetical protein
MHRFAGIAQSTMARAFAALSLAVATLVAANTAHAGDRAFYLALIDVSPNPAEIDVRRDLVWSALLGCNAGETLTVCRARHLPGAGEDTNGQVVLHPVPEAATAEVIRNALRGGLPARSALRAAYTDAGSWPDGIIVYSGDARAVTFSVLTPDGRRHARVRSVVPAAGPTPRLVASTVRTIMRPIIENFSP